MGLYDTTIGILLVSVFFNTFLYGLVTYQFVAYSRTKFNDRLVTRCMVSFLFLLDTFHSASVIYMMWNFIVTNYANPEFLGLNQWPYQITPLLTALVALITQIYLGSRIWLLTNSKILYGVVLVWSIVSFILGCICTCIIWVVTELPRLVIFAWLTTQVAVDVLITTTLVIIFTRSRSEFHRPDTVLNRLVGGAIQTGFLAEIFSLGNLISFTLLPNTNLYGVFAIPIGRIYTNVLMDNLLTRELLKEELSVTRDTTNGWVGNGSSQGTSSLQSTSDHIEGQRAFEQIVRFDPSTRSEESQDSVAPSSV